MRHGPGAALTAALLALTLGAGTSRGGVQEGEPAPDFTKSQLVYPPPASGPPRSLSEFAGKVVFLFVVGNTCPVCLEDGPSVELDIWRHYQFEAPGQVQVIGVDVYSTSSPVTLDGFRTSIGATFPLLLLGGSATGGNVNLLYGPNDSHFVISSQGIVRLNTLKWPHGARYRLNEIRACIDSLLVNTTDVGGVPRVEHSLTAGPNPFRDRTTIELVNAGFAALDARISVHDLAGRRVTTLWDGLAPAGATRLAWDGRDAGGNLAPAGIYLVHVQIGGTRISRRIVRIP